MTKWYIHLTRLSGEPELDEYTLTQKEDEPGWNAEGIYNGSGLPKELAQWMCDILNESNKECPYKMGYYRWEKI